jgi:hypothetical protein
MVQMTKAVDALEELERVVDKYDLRRPDLLGADSDVITEYLRLCGLGVLDSFSAEWWLRFRLPRPEAVIDFEKINAIVERRVADKLAEREQESALAFARSMALILRETCACAGSWGPKEIQTAVCDLPTCPPCAKDWPLEFWKHHIYEPIRRRLSRIEERDRRNRTPRSVPALKKSPLQKHPKSPRRL